MKPTGNRDCSKIEIDVEARGSKGLPELIPVAMALALLHAALIAFAPHAPLPTRTRVPSLTSVTTSRCHSCAQQLQPTLPPPTAKAHSIRRAAPRAKWNLALALALASFAGPRAMFAAGAASAAPKFTFSWGIPVVAGLLNLATNKLAVLMMFYPLRFRGLSRFFGLRSKIGWQGIVPGKAKQMSNKIVDDVVERLIDLKIVFSRLPPDEIARALEPTILELGSGLAHDLIERKGWSTLAGPIITSSLFNDTLRTRGLSLVSELVRDVQAEPEAVFDLRQVVVRGLASDPKVLVNLFERAGEKDLKFVVNSGFFLGGLLGVLQALLWQVGCITAHTQPSLATASVYTLFSLWCECCVCVCGAGVVPVVVPRPNWRSRRHDYRPARPQSDLSARRAAKDWTICAPGTLLAAPG